MAGRLPPRRCRSLGLCRTDLLRGNPVTGPSWWPGRTDRRVVFLVLFFSLIGGANLLWTSHVETTGRTQVEQQAAQSARDAIDANNRQWCDSLVLLTSGPVPTSKTPGTLRLYNDFRGLERRFGCDSK